MLMATTEFETNYELMCRNYQAAGIIWWVVSCGPDFEVDHGWAFYPVPVTVSD